MLRLRAFRSASPVLAAALIVLAAAPVHALARTVTINLNGGVSLPTGDFKSTDFLYAKSGFQFGGGVDYMITEKLAVGVDGSFNKNKHGDEGVTIVSGGDTYTLDKDRFTTIQFGAHAKWMFPMQGGPISPYALLGLGAYNLKEAWTETFTVGGTATTSSGDYKFGTKFGGKLGLGAMFKATEQVGIGLEGEYNFVSQDKADAGMSSLQFVGVHAGVSFNIVPK